MRVPHSGTGGPRSAGVAFLWIVILTFFILVVWSIHRSFVTSTLHADVGAVIEGRVCQLLAESAVDEMEARVAGGLNDPAVPLSMGFREQVGSRGSRDFDLTPMVDPVALKTVMKSSAFRGYRLEQACCRIALQRPIDALTCEKDGLLVSVAKVIGPTFSGRSCRRVEQARWFKTEAVTVPRPFGRYGMFIVDASGLTDVDEVNRCRARLVVLARTVRRLLTETAARVPLSSRSKWDGLARDAFDPDRPNAVPAPLPPIDGAGLYGVDWDGDPSDLALLDLAGYIRAPVEEAESRVRQLPDLLSRASLRTDDAGQELHGRIRDCLNSVIEPLHRIWMFHGIYRIIRPTGLAPFRTLVQAGSQLDPSFWRRRALVLLSGSSGSSGSIQTQFDRLSEHLSNGVIWVENPRGVPLRISGNRRGKLIVSVGAGGAEIQNVSGGPTGNDLLTVHSRSGLVKVSGPCRVSILLAAPSPGQDRPRLEIEPGASIHGSLAMASVYPGMVWRGTISADSAQESGFTDVEGRDHTAFEKLFVALSPRIFYRRVLRQ